MTKKAKNDQKWQNSWKLPKFADKSGSLSSYPFMGKSEAYTLEKGGGEPPPPLGGEAAGERRIMHYFHWATTVHDHRVRSPWAIFEKNFDRYLVHGA